METRRTLGEEIQTNSVSLNYKLNGHYLHAGFVVEKVEEKTELRDFLVKCSYVDSVYLINRHCDFFIKAAFPSVKKFDDFIENIKDFKCEDVQVIHLVDELVPETM